MATRATHRPRQSTLDADQRRVLVDPQSGVERDDQGQADSVDLGSGESANDAADAPTSLINLLEGQETRAFVVIDASRRGEPLVFE